MAHKKKPSESLTDITDATNLSPEIHGFLQSIKLPPEEYLSLTHFVLDRLTSSIKESKIFAEIDSWNKLYENFRIGLQLGFRNFFDAVKRSGEEIPDQEDQGSAWNWSTWERVARDLLNNFDNYCRKEILAGIEDPGTLLDRESVHQTLTQCVDKGVAGDAFIEASRQALSDQVDEVIIALKSKLDMSDNLQQLARNPSIISKEFETYLWANYITERKIGSYDNSLRGRLHISPRIAPKGQVTARLKQLQVAGAKELDAIAGKRANNDQLKALHDWARTNDRQFNVWEKICDDTKQFSPRSRARLFTNTPDS